MKNYSDINLVVRNQIGKYRKKRFLNWQGNALVPKTLGGEFLYYRVKK
jgi:hypothetical protein